MTYTEEFIPEQQGGESNEGSAYPSAFGITFTPTIGGIILAVLGLAGATYLFLNLVQPVWENHQKLTDSVNQLEGQVAQERAKLKNIGAIKAQLVEAQQQGKEVQALFSNEKTLDTLLLDMNRVIAERGGKLIKFTPEQPTTAAGNNANTAIDPSIVNDGSLGPQLNGKLKRKTVQVEVEGSFDQIQSIMRSVERSQRLLIVKDLKADLDKSTQFYVLDKQGKILPVGQPETTLKTSFKLQTLMPLTAAEEAAVATTAQPNKK